MAAEPSGASTMSGLILRVAEKLGIAEYTSTGLIHVPTDQFNLNLCKRYVNNGIRMFMADAPRKGWRWMRRIMSVTFTTRVTGIADDAGALFITDLTLADTYDTDDVLNGWYVYITAGTGIGSYAPIDDYTALTGKCDVLDWLDANGDPGGINPEAGSKFAITSIETNNGDTSRYTLPADFSGTVDGKIKYAANSNTGIRIEWCDESTIRARRAVTVNSGTPLLAAIRPYEPTSEALSATRRWEMIVDPMPYAADVVEFPYTLHFDEMKMESGNADAGGATYITDTNRWEIADVFNKWICTIVEGTGKGSYAAVTDYDSRNGSITAFATANAGAKTEVASATHGLTNGDVVTISGTTSYNGTHVISDSAAGTFEIEVAFVADDGASTWKQRQIEVAVWLNSVIDPDSTSKYILEPAANLHPAGHQFDDAIEAACLARCEAESQDEHFDTFWTDYYHKKALRNAFTVDMRSAPRTLGPMLGGLTTRGSRLNDDFTYLNKDGVDMVRP